MTGSVDVEMREFDDGSAEPCIILEEINDGECPLRLQDAVKLAVLEREDLDAYHVLIDMLDVLLERGFTAGFEA